jgi:radical SAM superfamily enzyme YgiQ (UPF0313 family)
MLGIYPARGCPYSCNFCSVVQIAGHRVRTQPIATTLASLAAAGAAGVRPILFTSDNFNKYPEVEALLDATIEEKVRLPFFVQCDAQVHRQPELVERLARAGCFQIFVGAESFDTAALRGARKFHNTPEKYREIVRLCRENGITSHFSNIIGFPGDTRASVSEHMRELRALGPDVASFYVLTPVPGTDQYEEFRRDGRITEANLDRFDGSCVTWRHPNLSAPELSDLLFRCYREFYPFGDVARKLLRVAGGPRDFRFREAVFAVAGYSLQSRWGVWTRTHPMAGGFGRVRLDSAADYAALRRRVFDVDLAPLPGRLALSPMDEEINRRAKLITP